jgi:hypothetical protein
VNIPADDYIARIRDLCDNHNLLLIVDEVQTGMGRTGKWFGYQNYDVMPDIMSLAKALGGGTSIGAIVAQRQVADFMVPGKHASTFGGNPLACAAGIAVFEAIDPGPLGAMQPFVLLAMMLGLTPFVRPLRWSRLFYTYLVPAVPLCFFWDAVVSWLRIYSPDDLRELVASVDPESAYDWEIGRGRTPGGPLLNVFLIGTPRQKKGG